MAISGLKRKTRPSKRVVEQQPVPQSCFRHIILFKFLYRAPATLAVLFLILFWSSSTTIISENMIRICVSSRKLTISYCLSAHPEFHSHLPLIAVTNTTSAKLHSQLPIIPVTNTTLAEFHSQLPIISVANKTSGEFPSQLPIIQVTNTTLVLSNAAKYQGNDSGGDEIEDRLQAMRAVEEQLQVHRSWAISGLTSKVKPLCGDKGIFVYDLPTKFNKDLLALCKDMMPWGNDFCAYFENSALGERLPKLGNGWYNTHQYALEPIFHSRVLNHPCRVFNKADAKLFYVPFYGGFDILRWHFKNVSTDVKDALGSDLIEWLESQDSWKKKSGKDHVFVLGKISWDFRRYPESSWGSNFLQLDQMQDPIKLLIERQPWHINDIGIPHPTYFHPHSDNDIISWQSRILQKQRKTRVSFAGGARPGMRQSIRSILIEQCTSMNNTEQCKFINCTRCIVIDCKTRQCDEPEPVIESFLESEFCLQPAGDSPTRKSVFDSLVAGCIPVLFDPFTAYYQYPWHLPKDHDKYSVFIDQEEVKDMKVNVIDKLMKISLKEREAMRRYIAYELLPGLVYGDSDSKFELFQDAFSITVNNLLHRVSNLDSVE